MIFSDDYKNKKVFITGATGFKGSWLSIWLQKLGADVTGYSLEPPTSPSMFERCKIDQKIKNIIGDVRDYQQLSKALIESEPEIIFHLAAQPIVRLSYEDPITTYETNILGTVNLLEAARQLKDLRAVVVVTTDKCYENNEGYYAYRETDPMGGFDPYSASKGCAELIVSSYRNSFYNSAGIALASARAGNVIGGGDWARDRLIPDFVKATVAQLPTVIRNPLATRPWQHVLEPLAGYLLLGQKMIEDPKGYNSGWNFGPRDSEIKTVGEILKLGIEFWGKGELKQDQQFNPHEANLLKLDITKATTKLHWEPLFTAKEAVEETISWYQYFYDNKEKSLYEYTVNRINNYESTANKAGLKWSD